MILPLITLQGHRLNPFDRLETPTSRQTLGQILRPENLEESDRPPRDLDRSSGEFLLPLGREYVVSLSSKIELFVPSRGRDVLFAAFPPPSMAPVTAGFWPFICPDSGPKYARSEKIPAPAFRCLGANLNENMIILPRQLPDLINAGAKNKFVLDPNDLVYIPTEGIKRRLNPWNTFEHQYVLYSSPNNRSVT